MLPKWMESVIDHRTEELLEEKFFSEEDEHFVKLTEYLNNNDSKHAKDIERLFYLRSVQMFRFGYKIGLKDMKELIK